MAFIRTRCAVSVRIPPLLGRGGSPPRKLRIHRRREFGEAPFHCTVPFAGPMKKVQDCMWQFGKSDRAGPALFSGDFGPMRWHDRDATRAQLHRNIAPAIANNEFYAIRGNIRDKGQSEMLVETPCIKQD
ncbi:hypothetical protein AL037_15355 [Salipiger aestuarii]|nr:hypothetical protein AL037_15355 [Salipiger aestuarii]